MLTTAADYAWFHERFPDLAEAYCLTLVRGLTPADLLSRIGARPEPGLTRLDAMFEPSLRLWDADAPASGRELLIGVTTVPGSDWALGIESNGFLGVTEEVTVPLSAGSTVVSHYRNFNAGGSFYWIQDGEIRLHFDPIDPTWREGTSPDALVAVMRQVGFDLDEDGETEHPAEASLALAEYLTGVRVTAELLEESTYQCGIAPLPDAPKQGTLSEPPPPQPPRPIPPIRRTSAIQQSDPHHPPRPLPHRPG